ncbi:ThiF family adenylyltransferase [Natronorubrum sp. A-ect3]|uniref:HesA/MoeB/ThiF family protein n=1 Tax=Natronorubrum sp. A-ect3 TaxID=3242698 RepID=UPI00359DE6B9
MGQPLDSGQFDRYSRQLMIDSIAESDQRSLLSSRVLVAGAGGLGSSVIQYLAAAGVGTIGVVDDGRVKRSNLQRQVVHTVDDIGEPKVESAARFVDARNPDVTVETHATRITPDTVTSLLEGYDVIVDGLDNFAARFLVNDAARLAAVPFVHGAVYELEGQLTVFRPGGPCYRCLLPAAPDEETVPSDEPMGIFPSVPGTIGTLQATEALKCLLDLGELLDGELLRYDAADATVIRTPLESNPDCPLCGSDKIDDMDDIDYGNRYRIES